MKLLKDGEERELTERYARGEDISALCRDYGVSPRTARRAVQRHRDIVERLAITAYVAYRDGWPIAVEYTREDLAEALGCATESIRRCIRRGKADPGCTKDGALAVFVVPMGRM